MADELTSEQRLRLMGLTPREIEAALFCGRGVRVREAANHLSVSESTVKTLLARARQKLGCADVRELSAFLLQENLLAPEDLAGRSEPR